MVRSTSIPKAGPVHFIFCYGQDPGQMTSFFWLLPLWSTHRSGMQGCSQQLPCELTAYSLCMEREDSPHPSSSPATSLACLPILQGVERKKKSHVLNFLLNEQMHKAAKGNQVKNKSAWLQAEPVIVNEV